MMRTLYMPENCPMQVGPVGAIRYAIAVGGDSDTIGAIVGSIAEAIWEIPDYIKVMVLEYLPKEMIAILKQTPNHNIL